MIKALALEFYKLRRRYVGLSVLLLVGVQLAWAFAAASMAIARNPDQAAWEPVIAIVASLNGLFAPIAAAICVSRIGDMEHKGNTWKLLLSLSVKRGRLYAAKYSCAALILLLACLVQSAAIAGFGIAQGFAEAVPLTLLARLLLGTMAAHLVIIALQLWLSLALPNQAFALCAGMIGGFLGVTGELFPSGIRQWIIWSYYSGLSPVVQRFDGGGLQFAVREAGDVLMKLGVLAAVGLVIYTAGRFHVSRQEV
ncbi:ABC transporter permease [Paenibacillus turpanensis]|uniref:ABC transporter permease n=1 Tax=Paenibacillus turpanensis TaxID=2689078 RepID=UPI001A9D5130|nr:ABC transporter permease [Paenibacillus turpanensis]